MKTNKPARIFIEYKDFLFFLEFLLLGRHLELPLAYLQLVPLAQLMPCSQSPHLPSESRAKLKLKMADNLPKTANIISRFTKLPDKHQATVLVSQEVQ